MPNTHPFRILVRVALLLAFAACSTACGADEEPETAEEPNASEDTADVQIREPTNPGILLPQTPMPTDYGLFFVRDDTLRPVEAGAATWVHPTNANRGFGFERPHGAMLSDAQPLFVLRSGSMQLSTLRLTRYEPTSLLPENWSAVATPGRAAWLPQNMIRLHVATDDAVPGVARFQPATALSAGFYALHDGSLIRGELKEDVTTYFPFQIIDPEHTDAASQEAVWFAQAERCLFELTELVIDNHVLETTRGKEVARFDRETFVRAQAPRMRGCASDLYAVMNASTDPEIQASASAALIALEFLHAGGLDDPATLWSATDPEHTAGALLSYWIELSAIDQAQELRRAVANDDEAATARIAAELSKLYLSNPITSDDALNTLLWAAYMLDPEWPASSDLTARIATGLDYWEFVAVLIGAHRARRLEHFGVRHPASPLKALALGVLNGVASDMVEARDGLDTSRGGSMVTIGPLHVGSDVALDPTLGPTIDRWFAGRRKGLGRCYKALVQRQGASPQGVILARISITQSVFGSNATLRTEGILTPGGTRIRLGDDAFSSCLEADALTGLPANLVAANADITVPLIFGTPSDVNAPIR